MLGIALEGGGARGAFHMGAVRALLENGYQFGGVTGTSIGALNGAIIAQGDVEAGYRMWESLNTPMLFNIDKEYYDRIVNKKFDKKTVIHMVSKVNAVIGNKGVDTSKIRTVVESIINEEKLRKSPVDFGLVTVEINGMKPLELFKEQIPEGQMVDYLMASASFPGFAPNNIDGRRYIDGGFYDNLPVNLLASKGYDEIIAVRTYAVGLSQKLKYKDIKIINILPSEDLGLLFDFDHQLISRNMKMGYYDALRVIKGLVGRHYYIEPADENYYFEMFANLSDEIIKSIGNIMGITQAHPKRMLFEQIIPKIALMLQLKGNASYEAIIISLMEVIAEKNSVEKYKVYSFDEFLNTIKIRKPSAVAESFKLPQSLQLLNTKLKLLKVSDELFHAII